MIGNNGGGAHSFHARGSHRHGIRMDVLFAQRIRGNGSARHSYAYQTMHQFVSVSSPSMMQQTRPLASALAASPVSNTVIVAVANFYGGSIIYRLDTAGTTLSSTNVMELNTRAAHDFEAVDLRPNGPVMLVGAEYDCDATLVYTFQEDPNAKQATLAGWPKCDDSDGLACASWAKAGECVHNPSFMHQSCPKACGAVQGASRTSPSGAGARKRGWHIGSSHPRVWTRSARRCQLQGARRAGHWHL